MSRYPKVKKVYLVSKGVYSDYSIIGVFSARDKADRLVSQYNEYEKEEPDSNWAARVEEKDLDRPESTWFHTTVYMQRDGTATFALQDMFHTDPEESRHNTLRYIDYLKYPANESAQYLVTSIATGDSQRAVKITNEYRAQIIAANAWGDTEKSYTAVGKIGMIDRWERIEKNNSNRLG